MGILSRRAIQYSFSTNSDVQGMDVATNTITASTNSSSPGKFDYLAMTTGFNAISVPSNSKAVTIIPPAANAVTLTLKGVTGDTGVSLHLTDPTSIALSTTITTFGVTVSAAVTLRAIWH